MLKTDGQNHSYSLKPGDIECVGSNWKKPFNIGIAYAYVKNTWVRCVSQYHTFLQGHSEKELMLASKEIRQQNQLHIKNRTVTARRLADFLNHASEHEAIRQQRIRDLEAKAILEAIAGSGGQAGVETLERP
jgi:hypothetical protein